jgi:hypothetical protein
LALPDRASRSVDSQAWFCKAGRSCKPGRKKLG